MNPWAWRRPIAGLWLVALGLTGLLEIRGLVSAMPPTILSVEEPFTQGVVSEAGRVVQHGFLPTPKGFAVGPGQQGELEYRLRLPRPLTPWSAITLQWYGGEAGVHGTLDLLGPNGPLRLLTDRSMAGSRLSLPASLSGTTDLVFRFTAQNATTAERLVLDKLTVQAWDGPPPAFPRPGWVGAFVLAAVLGLAGLSRRPRRAALVGGVLGLAVMLRYLNLLRVALAPLDPDAEGYRRFAELLTWFGPQGFYSAGFGEREPLFPALVKLFLGALGDVDLSLRLLTLGLSVAVVWLGYRVARELLGFGGGLAVGTFLAVSVPAIIESGRGLRMELESLLLLGLGWLLFGGGRGWSYGRGVWAGLCAGLLLLTRFPYVVAVLLLLGAAAWWHRGPGRAAWRPILVALAIAGLLVVPQRIALAVRHGDPAYDIDRTLRWIANREFAGRPGFPPPAAVERDPYAGPRITLGDYYLRLHAPGEVVWGSVRGLGRAIGNLSLVGYAREVQAVVGFPVGWLDLVVTALGAVGLGLLCRQRETAWLPVLLLLGLGHVAFVYDLDLPDYRYRMILQVLPPFATAVVAGTRWLAQPLIGGLWSCGRVAGEDVRPRTS